MPPTLAPIKPMPAPSALDRFAEEDAARLTMSYEAFLQWLDEDTHAEWMNGKVVMHSPVSAPHVRVGRRLISLLQDFLSLYRLGEILYEPFQMRIAPGGSGRAPDIVFVRRENAARIVQNVLRGPADMIVEIVSPGRENQRRDRVEKFGEYERGGVPEYWLIDPEAQTVEVYHLDEAGRYQCVIEGEDGRLVSIAITGFWVYPEWLWDEPNVLQVLQAWGVLPASTTVEPNAVG